MISHERINENNRAQIRSIVLNTTNPVSISPKEIANKARISHSLANCAPTSIPERRRSRSRRHDLQEETQRRTKYRSVDQYRASSSTSCKKKTRAALVQHFLLLVLVKEREKLQLVADQHCSIRRPKRNLRRQNGAK